LFNEDPQPWSTAPKIEDQHGHGRQGSTEPCKAAAAHHARTSVNGKALKVFAVDGLYGICIGNHGEIMGKW